jgi:hypothetical protein
LPPYAYAVKDKNCVFIAHSARSRICNVVFSHTSIQGELTGVLFTFKCVWVYLCRATLVFRFLKLRKCHASYNGVKTLNNPFSYVAKVLNYANPGNIIQCRLRRALRNSHVQFLSDFMSCTDSRSSVVLNVLRIRCSKYPMPHSTFPLGLNDCPQGRWRELRSSCPTRPMKKLSNQLHVYITLIRVLVMCYREILPISQDYSHCQARSSPLIKDMVS